MTRIHSANSPLPYFSFPISNTDADALFRMAGSIVAVVVAISAGVEALHNWGAIWLEKRKAAELLASLRFSE